MLLKFSFLWFVVMLSIESLFAETAVILLAISLSILLISSFILIFLGLDLLSLTFLIAYSSTSIFIYLLMMGVGDFARTVSYSNRSGRLLRVIVLTAIVSILLILYFFANMHTTQSMHRPRWLDTNLSLNTKSSNITTLVHFLLMRFFLIETLFLNFWLFTALLVAIGLNNLFTIFNFKSSTKSTTTCRVKRSWAKVSSSRSF